MIWLQVYAPVILSRAKDFITVGILPNECPSVVIRTFARLGMTGVFTLKNYCIQEKYVPVFAVLHAHVLVASSYEAAAEPG